MRKFTKLLIVGVALFMGQIAIQAQTTGAITGSVFDPNKAVVAGATIVVTNDATDQKYTAIANEEGNFRIASVNSGVYTATVSGKGFKTTIVKQIKVDVGSTSSLPIQMEVGGAAESVTITGGGELLKTDNATIGTTLTGRQITDIPTASRNALDLVLALPGTSTVGRPRQSSVNGLPKGALNITLDGMNVQDNLLKSNDGFFTYIQPRTDAISEVTVSSSNPGAESSGEGAFQIKFVTTGGGNAYHGEGYWYYRSPGLNSNYWFNNRDLPPDPLTGKAPRTPVILNQPGGKIGGPISIPGLFNGKDKAFFFFNYEEYRLPESTLRTRNVLSTAAQAGNYQFLSSTFTPPTTGVGSTTTCTGTGATRVCSVPLYTVIANCVTTNCTTGIAGSFASADPTISALLSQIRSSIPGSIATGDPNIEQSTFINHGGQTRRFPTVRLDGNLFKKHHVENIWNYQVFGSKIDFLNNADPAFPGFPNNGAQVSIRFSNSTAWRWTISNNIVNEARYGLVGGTTQFFPTVTAAQFTNQGGYNQGLGNFASGGLALQGASVVTAPSRRNSPVREFSDSLNWVKGNHSFNFGATTTKISFWQTQFTVVPSTVFTTSSALDPAPVNAFNFLPATQQAGAAQLYGLLSGRLTAFNSNARLNETTNQYSYLGPLISRAKSFEWGLFGQDSWRFRPNVTLTVGLRYEQQNPVQAQNNTYVGATYAALFGESGAGNLFKPGCNANPCVAGSVASLPGTAATYSAFPQGTQAYKTTGRFLPSIGLNYSPNFDKGFLHRIMGDSGQTVLRGGFSMASVREGTQVFQSVVGSNPGGTITTNRNLTLGNLPVGTYLRNGGLTPASFPSTLTVPNQGLITDSINAFDPNLKIGYVESWSVGVQREINKDNVVEIRYVGNRGHQLWRQVDLNELNIIENGVYNEFKLAQQNLLANIACGNTAGCVGGGLNFRYRGPGTGTSPLPITLAYLSGLSAGQPGGDPTVAANYSPALFASATWYNTLNPLNSNALGYGSLLAGTGFDNRRTAAGQPCYGVTTSTNAAGGSSAGCTGLGLFPYNMFYANAGKRADPFLVNNTGQTWYDGLTFEYRRRLSHGLLVQGSYTFGKALANEYASSSAVFDQPETLRNLWLKKGVTPFDIRHGFKVNFVYEVPVGKGRTFFNNSGRLVDTLIGGWGFNGNIRIQSGNPFVVNAQTLGGATAQQNVSNVQLIGITAKQLQKLVKPYRDPDGFIYAFPKEFRDNTVKAFNVGLTAAGGAVYTQGAPIGYYFAPAGSNNCIQAYIGQCGFANLILHGPKFTRFDLSAVKKIRVTERVNVEMRLEMLNAFNNINFLVGSAANDVNGLGSLTSSTFGRITAAYQDTSTTNDPGGRIGQLVLRIKF